MKIFLIISAVQIVSIAIWFICLRYMFNQEYDRHGKVLTIGAFFDEAYMFGAPVIILPGVCQAFALTAVLVWFSECTRFGRYLSDKISKFTKQPI